MMKLSLHLQLAKTAKQSLLAASFVSHWNPQKFVFDSIQNHANNHFNLRQFSQTTQEAFP
jgi:hypothetical protein